MQRSKRIVSPWRRYSGFIEEVPSHFSALLSASHFNAADFGSIEVARWRGGGDRVAGRTDDEARHVGAEVIARPRRLRRALRRIARKAAAVGSKRRSAAALALFGHLGFGISAIASIRGTQRHPGEKDRRRDREMKRPRKKAAKPS